MSIKPLADRVVAVKEAPQEKTASGILLGEAKETPNTATVSAIGPDVKNVKVGDRIIDGSIRTRLQQIREQLIENR